MRRRLLVTGFGPFPGIPQNPSATAARRVAASRRWALAGVEAEALVLATTYAALDAQWRPALTRGGHDAIVMIGVAGRAKRVRVEHRGVNRVSLLASDAEGQRPKGPATPGLPFARTTKVGVPALVTALRGRGLKAEASRNAGRYLCNAAYFQALAGATPVVFVHIPRGAGKGGARRRRRCWSEALAEALVDAGLCVLREVHRARRDAAATEDRRPAPSRPKLPGSHTLPQSARVPSNPC